MTLVRRFLQRDEAQDLIEYGLLASFIALACFLAIQALGPAISAFYVNAAAQITAAAAS